MQIVHLISAGMVEALGDTQTIISNKLKNNPIHLTYPMRQPPNKYLSQSPYQITLLRINFYYLNNFIYSRNNNNSFFP